MNKKHINFVLLLMVLMVPFFARASSLTTYGEAVTKANNYINSYNDRRKYLIFNKNYVYDRTGFGDSSSFTNGGMLSKSEYDLSVYMNQSYLATGKEYWTLTSDGSNKYYIDAFILSKNPNGNSGTRVTEYIKPNTIVNGKGTYANPWTFEEGYEVDVISNNTGYGTVSPVGAQYVTPGSTLRYTLTPSNGYFYNGNKDDCYLVKDGINKYENFYLIENIDRDIKCTAVYELKTYKFDLLLDTNSTDYEGNPKEYTTAPSPQPIYYKYKTNWYSDEDTNNVITKITPPTMTGWTFGGYYYQGTKVIDENGNIIVKNLDLGTTNDYIDTDHVLYATNSNNPSWEVKGFSVNKYNISYNLDGGNFIGNHPTDAFYDNSFTIDYPTKAGYSFAGWKHNGNSLTAKYKDIATNKFKNFAANSTVAKANIFTNLTPIKNATVTMTATWSICPAGTYSDGSTSECQSCPSGYTSLSGADAQNKCFVSCDVDQYVASVGAICTSCSTGYSHDAGTINYGSKSSDCVDVTPPSCSVSVSNKETTSGVTTTVTCTDNGSGCKSSNPTGETGLKSSKTYTVYDNANNSATCSVTVTSYTMYRSRSCTTFDRCSAAGCAEYNSCPNSSCGVEHYDTCPAAACGSNYKRNDCKTGHNTCSGGYICQGGSFTTSCNHNAQWCAGKSGSFTQAAGSLNSTGCCYYCTGTKKWSDCASGENTCTVGWDWLSYKSCEDSSCGVSSYNSCPNSSCSCKTYNRAERCGCYTWGDYGPYNQTSCSNSNSNDCDSATFYK